MKRYVLQRLLAAAITIWLMSMIVFVGVRFVGDPVHLLLPPEATEQDRAVLRDELGLAKPLPQQYLSYVVHLMHGDIGRSFVTGQPAFEVLRARLAPSAILAGAALVLSLLTGVPGGIAAALHPYAVMTRVAQIVASLGLAIPSFLIALLLIRWLSVDAGLLPTSGYGTWRHLVIPAISLSLYMGGALFRLTQSAMSDVLRTEFIRFARIKGISRHAVIYRHALKSCALIILTFSASQFGMLLTGAVSVEVIFGWPGIGGVMVDAISQFDYTVIQAAALMVLGLFVLLNLLLDLAYGWLDPRIRLAH
ncbi:ABC transporter permease [Burkholderia multivorans]|uniref:ABC transporter permease n=1 Tax=Burkholderia multivorans TaxID=87883 RepID=UPI0021C1462D|nr:ABC transporter permease [Burkholderia multivorans]MDR8761957.1 Glutathione transport system permease protein GsiC [Burkholderia multivorans]MDR8766241.1 Glutathione transport system permease protein GsiC [Burkholderia multivorans]MDR8769970.1 Glutathione transport system permease protein GsiC [Burkholderia multivorans]MDR8792073.1 Glutathione transport system permease protein GsiC [Burkholderia multivorans]MDR8794526.1 Glutathione transport system permease protein GsiC [Burkholderia multiv